jgi:four helix bundle protein
MSADYRDLVAWQRAMELAERVYDLTRQFPKEEIFGLTSQLRRSAVSIASNIAEGQGRLTPGDFCHFLGHSRGSLLELLTQLELAHRLKFIEPDRYDEISKLAETTLRLINGLIRSLK